MSDFFDTLSNTINTNPAYTIPIFIFVIGILFNEIVKIAGRYQDRRNYRVLLSRNYLIFKDYLIVQATNLNTFEQQITAEQSPNFNFYLQPCSAISNFKDISYNNAYKALFTGFENLSFRKKLRKIQAFDYLYTTISMFQLDQERVFPILTKYHDDVKPLVEAINISGKIATEAIGDIGVIISKKGNNESIQKWLSQRELLTEQLYSSGFTLSKTKDYYTSVLQFETSEPKPIASVMTIKEFWNYHHILRIAIADIIKLERLVLATRGFCNKTSENFKTSAFQLTTNYNILFGKRLR